MKASGSAPPEALYGYNLGNALYELVALAILALVVMPAILAAIVAGLSFPSNGLEGLVVLSVLTLVIVPAMLAAIVPGFFLAGNSLEGLVVLSVLAFVIMPAIPTAIVPGFFLPCDQYAGSGRALQKKLVGSGSRRLSGSTCHRGCSDGHSCGQSEHFEIQSDSPCFLWVSFPGRQNCQVPIELRPFRFVSVSVRKAETRCRMQAEQISGEKISVPATADKVSYSVQGGGIAPNSFFFASEIEDVRFASCWLESS